MDALVCEGRRSLGESLLVPIGQMIRTGPPAALGVLAWPVSWLHARHMGFPHASLLREVGPSSFARAAISVRTPQVTVTVQGSPDFNESIVRALGADQLGELRLDRKCVAVLRFCMRRQRRNVTRVSRAGMMNELAHRCPGKAENRSAHGPRRSRSRQHAMNAIGRPAACAIAVASLVKSFELLEAAAMRMSRRIRARENSRPGTG